jgi:putative hydrolase of the HAD superfamily
VIRAVFFDAGATLVHPSPPVEEIYARELAADGAAFTREELDSALSRAWEEVHAETSADRYGGVRGEAAFWQAFLNRVRGSLDGGTVSGECFARLARHFRSPSAWALYPDVIDTLQTLDERGLALAIVSNWDSHLPALLDALDLSRRFQAVAVSAIEETGKPDAEIFRRVCARLNIPASACLHVGDSRREDYEGARSAGLHALLLDRQGKHADVEHRIESLREIPDALVRFE